MYATLLSSSHSIPSINIHHDILCCHFPLHIVGFISISVLRVWTHAQLNNVMLSAHMMGQVSQGLGEREREERGEMY